MTVGNLWEDPWEKAYGLPSTMTRQVLLFDRLWQSEPDKAKFEDLCDWVIGVKKDVRTKLKALELFMRLYELKTFEFFMHLKEKQQSGVETHSTRTCDPPPNNRTTLQ